MAERKRTKGYTKHYAKIKEQHELH
jgi:hypothetical protein